MAAQGAVESVTRHRKEPPNGSQACAGCVNLSAERRKARCPDRKGRQPRKGQTDVAPCGAPSPSRFEGKARTRRSPRAATSGRRSVG